jgi:hypothetical protein
VPAISSTAFPPSTPATRPDLVRPRVNTPDVIVELTPEELDRCWGGSPLPHRSTSQLCVATAFTCRFHGPVPERQVLDIVTDRAQTAPSCATPLLRPSPHKSSRWCARPPKEPSGNSANNTCDACDQSRPSLGQEFPGLARSNATQMRTNSPTRGTEKRERPNRARFRMEAPITSRQNTFRRTP